MQPIITAIENNKPLTAGLATVAIILSLFAFSGESVQEAEQRVAQEKARLNVERTNQVKDIEAELVKLRVCIAQVNDEMDTITPITPCGARNINLTNSGAETQTQSDTSTGSTETAEAPQA
jgi:hypothetical protein